MKKSLFILSLAALATLAGCQREDDLLKNPVENGGVQEVTTQFVLNVAAAPQTKMSAEAVQQADNFRGIDNGVIIAYKTEMADANKVPYVLKTTGWAATDVKRFDLGTILGDGTLYNDGSIDPVTGLPRTNQDNQSKRVLQLSIPIETDAVLIYGKAIKTNAAKDSDYGATLDLQDENPSGNSGSVISDNPGNTVFKAKKILSNETIVAQYDQTAALMIFVINNILSRDVAAYTDETWGDLPALSWAELGHQYEYNLLGAKSRYPDLSERTLTALEEIMGRCYYDFTYMKPSDKYVPGTTTPNPDSVRPNGEYRAGSSYAVREMVTDMYKVIYAAYTATPTNAQEANAKRLAGVVLDRALVYFDRENGGVYRTISEINSYVTSNGIITSDEWNAKYAKAKDLNNYPYGDFGVPEGAAQLGFFYNGQKVDKDDVQLKCVPSSAYESIEGDTGHVKFVQDIFFYYHPNKPLVNPTMTTFEPRKYMYPAELWYYVNSPIRTTSKDNLMSTDYPNGVTPWNDDASWTADAWVFPGKVISSTRGVAVKNNVNYGVALLKSAVICEAATLEDNRKAMTNGAEENRTFSLADANLSLRGVLVGGVNPRMNWQFVRRYASEAETAAAEGESAGDLSLFDGVIYDHSLTSGTIAESKATANWNYTLVYDNYNSSKAYNEQNGVYVALEFVNNGPAFWGRDNLIRNGAVFYLVGELPKPTETQANAIVWPTDHQIPPVYGVDDESIGEIVPGTSKHIARVFIQDFVTEALFKMGSKALQKAYYSVPDLRAVQMSLGLSVDLKWEPGIEYEINL